MKKKRQIALVLLSVTVLVAMLISAGCAPKEEVVPAEEPLLIGRTLPLTGVFSETADLLNKGAEYWVERVNSEGGLLGRSLKMIVYDDAGSPDKQVSLLEKLITVDKVDFVLGGYPTMGIQNQAPVDEKYGMVNISLGGSPTSFAEGFKYCFGLYQNAWGPIPMFEWIETTPEVRKDLKTMAILTMNNPIGLEGRETCLEWAEKVGIKVVVDDKYDLPLESADAMMAKVKASEADIFMSLSFFDDGALQIRAAQLFGYQPKVFFQFIGASTPAFVEELGPAAEGAFSHAMACSDCLFPGLDQIHTYWTEHYGGEYAPVYFILGYLYPQILQIGIEGAGSYDQAAIRDYLKSHTITTVIGDITFGEDGWPKEVVAFNPQIINGKCVNVAQPQYGTPREPLYPHPKW